jgi:hypothetical protein
MCRSRARLPYFRRQLSAKLPASRPVAPHIPALGGGGFPARARRRDRTSYSALLAPSL